MILPSLDGRFCDESDYRKKNEPLVFLMGN